ncbi:integrase catalytic subunit [Mycobacterium intracellulare subsp. chimaera]|uniref:Integrase catalytic subunit n=1 Tax=Mycobacterium intracellulare subsp. chimaera TaxID=222805 RepID=A0A7U5MJK0_MYCIT|nr:integrase catalytic subunit [Mycobacterium intracellulare subsp. chimaera]
MDIISAYHQLGSYRAAAEHCGTTHRTVKKIVEKFEAGQAGMPLPARAERAHNYDLVADLVAERVQKSHGRISAKRLLPIAKAAGYEGSARNFRRLVAEAKALWRSNNHRGRRPAVWEPGEYLVIDWAQAAPGLFLFCAVLAFSRWRFVRFASNERASTTLALIAESLAAESPWKSRRLLTLETRMQVCPRNRHQERIQPAAATVRRRRLRRCAWSAPCAPNWGPSRARYRG